jgi:hypothetical protein
MNLNALFSMMFTKGYHYFEGSTKITEDTMLMTFSTKINGCGDKVELMIGTDNIELARIVSYVRRESKVYRNITETTLFELI